MCNNPGNFTEAFGSFKLQVLMLFPVYKDFFFNNNTNTKTKKLQKQRKYKL